MTTTQCTAKMRSLPNPLKTPETTAGIRVQVSCWYLTLNTGSLSFSLRCSHIPGNNTLHKAAGSYFWRGERDAHRLCFRGGVGSLLCLWCWQSEAVWRLWEDLEFIWLQQPARARKGLASALKEKKKEKSKWNISVHAQLCLDKLSKG